MGSYPAQNVTTEVIQKYLDENKQLILAIVENQNMGKSTECAAYQARLQANLMYLAAIADSQPQLSPNIPQAPPATVSPMAYHYMAQQQAQQQMVQQSLVAARNPFQFSQQSSQQQQYQAMSMQHGMHSVGNSSLPGIPSGAGGMGGFPDLTRMGNTGGEDLRGNKLAGSDAMHGSQSADEPEPSYLKASEDEGN